MWQLSKPGLSAPLISNTEMRGELSQSQAVILHREILNREETKHAK
jgi:hypothetical protein